MDINALFFMNQVYNEHLILPFIGKLKIYCDKTHAIATTNIEVVVPTLEITLQNTFI